MASRSHPLPFLRGVGERASKLIVVGHGVQVHSVEEIDDREPRIVNMCQQQMFEGGVWFLVRLTDYPGNQLHPFKDRDRVERAGMLAEFNGVFVGILQVTQVVCHGGVMDRLEHVEIRNDGGDVVQRVQGFEVFYKGCRWEDAPRWLGVQILDAMERVYRIDLSFEAGHQVAKILHRVHREALVPVTDVNVQAARRIDMDVKVTIKSIQNLLDFSESLAAQRKCWSSYLNPSEA